MSPAVPFARLFEQISIYIFIKLQRQDEITKTKLRRTDQRSLRQDGLDTPSGQKLTI